MKTCSSLFSQVLTLIFTLTGPFVAHAADNPWDMRLPFENATIHYEITGMESGKESLFIKDSGNYRALHHDGTTTVFGMTTRSRRVQIIEPDWQYTFDLEEGTGSKVTNPKKYFQQEYARLSAGEQKNVNKNAEELGLTMVKDFKGQTEINAATILGYSCDRTSIAGMTVYVIHKTDIPLLTEVDLGMMRGKTEATAVDLNPPPGQAFALPVGIEPVYDAQTDELSRQMAARYIATLKEPDGAEKMRQQMRTDTLGGTGNLMADEKEQQPPEEPNAAGGIQENMQQGLDLLQGLFGK